MSSYQKGGRKRPDKLKGRNHRQKSTYDNTAAGLVNTSSGGWVTNNKAEHHAWTARCNSNAARNLSARQRRGHGGGRGKHSA